MPGIMLPGKSPEYIAGYSEGYQKKAKEQNALWAAGGCAVAALCWGAGCVVYVLFILALPQSY